MLTEVQAQSLATALQSIKAAAPQVQARLEDRNCEQYALADVEQLMVKWFLESVDQLALEAVYHTTTGDRSYAFNRDSFNRMAAKLEPVEQPELVAA